MLLTLKRSLIHTRDARGNNLLHIAAKSRNVELFEFLMKKAGSSALECKNHVILRVDSLEKHR
jgi:ankyrin repeat protein